MDACLSNLLKVVYIILLNAYGETVSLKTHIYCFLRKTEVSVETIRSFTLRNVISLVHGFFSHYI